MEELHTDNIDKDHEGQLWARSRARERAYSNKRKREKNASLSKNKDLSNIKYYNCYKKGYYAITCAEPDTREKSKNKQSKKLKKD
jgi:hypothetical protein